MLWMTKRRGARYGEFDAETGLASGIFHTYDGVLP